MYSPDGMKDKDNNSDNAIIITEFRSGIRIHEHDFISEEQESIIICSVCGLVYCEKCGKLVIIYHKNYMEHNTYN